MKDPAETYKNFLMDEARRFYFAVESSVEDGMFDDVYKDIEENSDEESIKALACVQMKIIHLAFANEKPEEK